MARSSFFTSFICSVTVGWLLGSTPLLAQDQPVSTPPVSSVVPPSPTASPTPAAPSPDTAAPSPAPAMSTPAPDAASPTPAESGTTHSAPVAAVSPTPPPSRYRIEIDLGKQRAYLLKDNKNIAESPVSSGRPDHLTPTGHFSVIEKDLNHLSSLYGKIVEKGSGRTVKAGADSAMPVPKGCKFERAPMKFFMRFEGAAGMHAGILPGYAASHGCVRMPAAKAELFYKTVDIGTPVHVYGTPPAHEHERERETPSHSSTKPAPSPTPAAHKRWWPF